MVKAGELNRFVSYKTFHVRIGYRGKSGRLESTLNFAERYIFLAQQYKQWWGHLTLDSERPRFNQYIRSCMRF